MISTLLSQQKTFFTDLKLKFPTALKILYTFLVLDLLFVLLHAFSLTLPLTEETKLLRLDMDFGYAEIYQYIKFLFMSLLLIVSFVKEKLGVYLIWSLFFLFLFVDDALAIHEIFGGKVNRYFNFPGILGLRAQDLGELFVVGIIGGIFLLCFLYTWFYGRRKTKKITVQYILFLGILVFFGVFVDMVHSILVDMPGSGIITVIEDSGEMMATSILLWYTLTLFFDTKKKQNN